MFQRIQHTDLLTDVAALKATITTSQPGTISYTTVCNHLSTAVSQLPEYVAKNRNISVVGKAGENKGIYHSDGSIIANEWIPDWNSLSKEDRRKVLAERNKLGIKLGQGGKGGGTSKGNNKMLSKLKKENTRFKRRIKALETNKAANQDDNKDSDKEVDAGDQFGGKNSKKRRKNNN